MTTAIEKYGISDFIIHGPNKNDTAFYIKDGHIMKVDLEVIYDHFWIDFFHICNFLALSELILPSAKELSSCWIDSWVDPDIIFSCQDIKTESFGEHIDSIVKVGKPSDTGIAYQMKD